MKEFIFSFLGAILGSLTMYFMHKAFVINKELNLKSNRDEVLAAMDEIDKGYAEDKVESIKGAIAHYKTILPHKDINSKRYIKASLTYYCDWLNRNRSGIKYISESVRNELKAEIEELLNSYNEEIL